EAAEELSRRLRPWLPARVWRALEMGTLHSRLLRWWIRETGHVPRILTQSEQADLVERILRNTAMSRDEALARLAIEKSRHPEEEEGWAEKEWLAVRRAYQQELLNRGLWDFDDILIHAYERLAEGRAVPPWRAVLVDEAQDLNRIQTCIIERLGAHASVFLIGDDDQSVYRFRGAVPAYFQSYLGRPDTKVYYLSLNYRSHSGLVECANRLISRNADAQKKPIRALRTGPPPEVRVFSDEWEQYAWLHRALMDDLQRRITPGVLARTHRELEMLSRRFRSPGRTGGIRGAGPASLFFTFHGSKGMEFHTVYIVNAVEGCTPFFRPSRPTTLGQQSDDADLREERRLFYVAVTRARDRLVMCVPKMLEGQRAGMSRFVRETGADQFRYPAQSVRNLVKKVLRPE
ncbi:MAG: ATP-dependent helicase, partial [Alicyclobacillaceae bacterium]|nr:ATP-dependent helicase [Alicyclobacillaceae bacterium]